MDKNKNKPAITWQKPTIMRRYGDKISQAIHAELNEGGRYSLYYRRVVATGVESLEVVRNDSNMPRNASGMNIQALFLIESKGRDCLDTFNPFRLQSQLFEMGKQIAEEDYKNCMVALAA